MSKSKPFIVPAGRLSFPHLFEPSTFGSNPKFEATIVWPLETDLGPLEKEIERVANEKWGAKKWPKGLRFPLHDNEEKEGMSGYDSPGRYMKFWSYNRPRVVHSEKNSDGTFREAGEHEIYAGCWVRASMNIYAFTNKEYKTHDVIGGLLNIQFVKDDEPLSGSSSDPDSDFSSESLDEVLM